MRVAAVAGLAVATALPMAGSVQAAAPAGATARAAALSTDPAVVGAWSGVLPMNGIAQHLAVLPGTNKVLHFDSGAAASVLDPSTGAETPVPVASNMWCAGHAFLPDGRLAVIGGGTDASGGVGNKNTVAFDAVTQTWSSLADMSSSRWYPTATTLPDGRLLAVSGSSGSLTNLSNTPEVLDPATNAWTSYPSGTKPIPYYPFMYVLPDGRVVAAGATEQGTNTQVLQPSTMTWSTMDAAVIDAGSSTMYGPGTILKAGTASDGNTPVRPSSPFTYVLDATATTPTWRQVGSMAFPRAFLNLTTLPDGNVLATGGETTADGINSANAVHAAEEWSPVSQSWTTLASMATPRLYHSVAALLPDGRVIVSGGGNDGAVPNEPNYELYSPPYLFKGSRPTITSAPLGATFGATFSVATPQAASIRSVALISPAAVSHSFDANARFVPLSFTQGTNSLTVQAPANANIAPPGPYMLFIIDSNGVPSVAPWVSLQRAGGASAPVVSVTAPAAGASVSGSVSLSASALASGPATVSSVQFLLDGAAVGVPVTTAPYTMTWNSTTVANGVHTIGATAVDSRGATGTASRLSVSVSNVTAPPSGISVDRQVFKDGSGAVSAGPMTTTGPDLLVALVSADGPSGQSATVSGGGLTWTLAKRANAQAGTSEVWTAPAAGALTGATVTSTLASASFDQSLTVLAYKGATAVGASAAASAATGAPTVSVTTTRAGSQVLAAGNDWDAATARTLAPNQTMLHQFLDTTAGDTFWSQSITGTTPATGTTVTVNDTAPTNHRWNLAAIELLAQPG